jgi:uncharacterized protein (DUF1330 family)
MTIAAAGAMVSAAGSAAGAEGEAIEPAPEVLDHLAKLPDAGPVVMLNLLKFKPDGGMASYMKYSAAVQPILQKIGASMVYVGRAEVCLLGGQDWDVVALLKYPSRQAFLDMIASEEYLAIHHYRAEGLDHQVLYATAPAGMA